MVGNKKKKQQFIYFKKPVFWLARNIWSLFPTTRQSREVLIFFFILQSVITCISLQKDSLQARYTVLSLFNKCSRWLSYSGCHSDLPVLVCLSHLLAVRQI